MSDMDCCNPYAWNVLTIKGKDYCAECGRAVRAHELFVVSNPRNTPPHQSSNSYQRGLRTDQRGVPYLDRNGRPLKLGEAFNPRDYGEGSFEIPFSIGAN